MIIFKTLKQHLITWLMCLVLVILSTQSIAAQLYRYKNEQGNLVIGQTIPPKFVSKGYDILNLQGRVLETIAPALTPEQIAARDAQLEIEKQAKIEQAKQAEIDDKLKQLYSHPDDAVRILERRTQDIKNVISVKKSRISNAQKQIREQEELAAQNQRKGYKVPERVLEKINTLTKDINNSKADIDELEQEFDVVLTEFDIKIRRLEHIKKKKSEKYVEFLESLKLTNKREQ